MARIEFPAGFRWGCATASYQIEGSPTAGGKGESIWDRFSHTAGRIADGETGDVACRSFERWRDDIALLRQMNCTSYRFSIAWPRIQPTGRGPANPAGVDYYGSLIDALLAAGIRPLPTLYHWDLPQALEEAGGWPERDTAGRFADYAEIAMSAFGDRVDQWTIFNEPNIFTLFGYRVGIHAPGRRDLGDFWRATHVVNLAQADAYHAMKAVRGEALVGSAPNFSPCEPHGDAERDERAAEQWSRFQNEWFLTPAFEGRYPDVFAGGEDELARTLALEAGDLARVQAPLDWIGVNLYTRTRVAHAEGGPLGIDAVAMGNGDDGPRTDSGPLTDFGWEVWPDALRRGLEWVSERYAREGTPPILEVTESGCSYADGPDADGRIRDTRRTDFYRGALAACAEAIANGVDLRGYHAWTLLDNFEWAEGYRQRFGLAWLDRESGERTLKESGQWFGRVAAENGFDDEEGL